MLAGLKINLKMRDDLIKWPVYKKIKKLSDQVKEIKKNRFYKAGPKSRNYRLFFENIKIDSSYFDFDVDRKDDSEITF